MCSAMQRCLYMSVVLKLWSVACAVSVSMSSCEVKPVGEDHPVQAMLKRVDCPSRGTGALPREVHVISLQDSSPQEARERPAQVELHLQPHSLAQLKPLVLVLSSRSVLWKIGTQTLAPAVGHMFVVANGSEVHFVTGSFSQSFEVKSEPLPQGNDQLFAWVLQRFHGVSSFSEVQMRHDIYIKVGEDSNLSKTCEMDKKFLSSYMDPQPSTGCTFSSSSNLNQEVHIIELQSPDIGSLFHLDVTVDLRVKHTDVSLHCDIVLLLKCDKPVNWVIKSHNIIGKLQMVSSDTISLSEETEHFLLVSETVKTILPAGSTALIQWAEENGLSPVTSYTKTLNSNYFNVYVRKQAKDALPSPTNTLITPPSVYVVGHEENWGSPISWFSVQCEKNKLVIGIDKKAIQTSGHRKTNITLRDANCKASSNSTHYILETLLSGCQTTKHPFFPSPVVVYMNSIVIRESDELLGSGWTDDHEDDDDEDEESEHVVLPGDPQRPHTEIPINCTYVQSPKSHREMNLGGNEDDNISYSMELYNNPFHYPSTDSFLTITENKPIYVEISATNPNHKFGFMIQTCFISPDSNPLVLSEYVVIENICPKEDSVLFYPQHDPFPFPHSRTNTKRFSFNYRSKFNMSLLFLHCEMFICLQRKDKENKLPECMLQDKACTNFNLHNKLLMRNTKTSSKPVVVVSEHTPVTQTSIEEPPPFYPGIIYMVDVPVVVGISFAAFVIGALLTGALWLIYSRTERKRHVIKSRLSQQL